MSLVVPAVASDVVAVALSVVDEGEVAMVVDLSTSSTNTCLPQQVVRIQTQDVLALPAMLIVCAWFYVWAKSTFHRSLGPTALSIVL